MAYRDVLYSAITSVFVVRGLGGDALARVPAAFAAVVRARPQLRRRWPAGPVRRPHVRRVAEAIDASLRALPTDLPDAELIARTAAQPWGGLPVAVTTTPAAFVLAVAHGAFDGAGALDVLLDVLDAAAGVPSAARKRPATAPMLRALVRLRPRDARRFLDQRRRRPEVVASSASPSTGSGPRTAAFHLEAADVVALRGHPAPPGAGRPTLLTRVASAALAALAVVAPERGDAPVEFTFDLRHLVRGEVSGNFIGAERLGTLRDGPWDPGGLAVRLADLRQPYQALKLLTSTSGWLLRRAGRGAPSGVTVTLMATRRTLPASLPVESVTVATVGSTQTLLFAWSIGDGVFMSLWSPDAAFDAGRFESAFRRAVL